MKRRNARLYRARRAVSSGIFLTVFLALGIGVLAGSTMLVWGSAVARIGSGHQAPAGPIFLGIRTAEIAAVIGVILTVISVTRVLFSRTSTSQSVRQLGGVQRFERP